MTYYLYGVNLPAVFVCGIVYMVIGGIWYSPMLFAKQWTILHGMDPNDKAKMDALKASAPRMYGLAFLCGLLQAAMLAKFMSTMGIANVPTGLKIAFAVWLGFVATVQLTGNLFGMKPFKLWPIDTGYQLVCYLAFGAILSAWK
jgi:hypothetical protein